MSVLVRRSMGAAAVGLLAGLATASAAHGWLPVEPAPLPTTGASAASAQAGGDALTGTFRLTAGACEDDVNGTWFRMIQPGGSASGPYVTNTDSPCADQSYTPLSPGSDAGLVTGRYQEQPDPPFDTNGGGLADRITRPQRFFGVDFATATNPADPQTGRAVPAPSITVAVDGRLGGDLRAFAASWNNQHFNQGAPKPDGGTPGATAGPSGTYDETTGEFVLEWTSQIVGGPFNNFTGQWHFEGTFSAREAAAAPARPGPSTSPAARVATGSGATATSGDGALASTGPAFPDRVPLLALGAGTIGLLLARLARGRDAHT